MHKTDLIWGGGGGGTWGGTANFWGACAPPQAPLGDATAAVLYH